MGLSALATGDRAPPNLSDAQEDRMDKQPANDMKAAEQTYRGFVGLLKWTVPLVAAIVFLVVLLIA